MYVEEHGPIDGSPVVLLHGSLVAGWIWQPQLAGLGECRVLVPDLPGFGRSGDVPWPGLDAVADEVAALLADCCADRSAHVVGISTGGLVGLNLAVRHPDVVRTLLVSSVLVEPTPAALRALGDVVTWLYRRTWGVAVVARFLRLPDDESRRQFAETARQSHPTAPGQVSAEVSRNPLPRGLDRALTPTLVVAGAEDAVIAHRALRVLPATMPDARAALVPGVGHYWNAEQPELFADMVRAWLTDRRIDPRLQSVSSEGDLAGA